MTIPGTKSLSNARSTSISNPISCLKFSPDGLKLASSSSDKSIKLWSLNTEGPTMSLQLLKVLSGVHIQGISDVAWNFNGRYLASAADDAMVVVWDIESGEPVRTLEGHTSYVFCVNFNPAGTLLASGSFDETIKIWDLSKGRCLRTIPAHSDPITSVEFSPDGTILLSSSYDGLVRMWETNSGQCLRTLIDNRNHAPIGQVKFSQNGRYLITSHLDNTLAIWSFMDSNKGCTICTLTGHVTRKYCGNAHFLELSMPPNGDKEEEKVKIPMVVSGSEDGTISFWSLKGPFANPFLIATTALGPSSKHDPSQNRYPIYRFKSEAANNSPIIALALSPDHSLLAYSSLSSTGGQIQLLNLKNHVPLLEVIKGL